MRSILRYVEAKAVVMGVVGDHERRLETELCN